MKKLLLILMVLGVAAPLFAQGRIQFYVTNNGNGSATVTYDCNDTYGIAPVAMGLEIKVTSGTPISEVTDVNPFFDIYMDAAYSMETDPCCLTPPCYTYGAGTPIADPCGPGEIALPSSYFVISMGGLGGESEPLDDPCMSGTMFTLWSEVQDPCQGGTEGGTATGTIKVDPLRGGIIGEDGEPMETNLDDPAKAPPWVISECAKWGSAFYNNWRGRGSVIGALWKKPRCWCYEKNCRGDADGVTTLGKRVAGPDLSVFLAGWNKKANAMAAAEICADFDHIKTLGKFVAVPDLGIFLANWNKKDIQTPACPPDWDAIPDAVNDYNFWIDPVLGFVPIP